MALGARGSAADVFTIGLIGCGGRGQWIANLFAQTGEYCFVSCKDVPRTAGSQSRNHCTLDACMREDKTRSKHYGLNCNLPALRVCLIALKAHLEIDGSWPELQERCQHDPSLPARALLKPRVR